MLLKKKEQVVFSIENITFAILICIARFLVKESASITMCSFTNTLCAITGDSKKGYNIGIPGIYIEQESPRLRSWRFSHFMTITPESPNLFDQLPEESPNLFGQIPEKSPNVYTDIAGIATDTGNLKSETRKVLHPSPYHHKHLIYKHLQAQ